MQLTMIRADNGYIVEYEDYYEDTNEPFIRKALFEDKDDELGHVDSLLEALYLAVQILELPTNKYSAKRLHIEIRPGDYYKPSENHD